MTTQAPPRVTVTVLTFNRDRFIDAILTAVEAQTYDGDVDILVVDSGSTEDTLSIVASHSAVRLHAIPNSEFGHGKTRNLAAHLAASEVVAYLTHDAAPSRLLERSPLGPVERQKFDVLCHHRNPLHDRAEVA
jgi:glycosyltransferase involved in cell wall biosynthesis